MQKHPQKATEALTKLRVWGMSLSYASADNSAGSPSPVTLADTLVVDDSEFIIMTDNICGQDDCGTVRQGTVAYRKSSRNAALFRRLQ